MQPPVPDQKPHVSGKFRRTIKWFASVALLIYFTWGGGCMDLAGGRIHRKAAWMFADIGQATEVRIYLLNGEDAQETAERFKIGFLGKGRPVYGSAVLTSADGLAEFKKLWEGQLLDFKRGSLCHYPPYGFRWYQNGALIRETTICWGCSNFSFAVWPGVEVEYTFADDTKEALALLAFCEQRLPYKHDQPKETGNSER